MDNITMAHELIALVQRDIDAAHIYGRAIPLIESAGIRGHLARFRKDHERHIEQLSAVIRALDAEPPPYNPDCRGFFAEEAESLSSLTGAEEILRAVKTSEELNNDMYCRSSEQFTPNIRELVARNYLDEQVHLKFLQEVLAVGAWEEEGPATEDPRGAALRE